MSYAVSATTPMGAIKVHSSYVPEIRHAIAEAREDGARKIDLSRDGQPIEEADLGRLTSQLVEESTITKFA